MASYGPGAATTFDGPLAPPSALAERLLNVILFITVALSAIAFIEPSPHDVMMLVLLVACVTARVRFDRKLVPLLILIILWLIGGGLSLIQVGDEQKPIQYFGTSVYLGIATMIFACLTSDGDPARLRALRRGYLIAAGIAAAVGFIGFFHLLPGSDAFLALSEDGLSARVSATFKDPNVFGPFLIFPMLLLIITLLREKIRLLDLAVLAFFLGGLFLSFSRGAWIHFALSALLATVFTYSSTQDPRKRARIVVLGFFTVVGMALIVMALDQVPAIHEMLLERAKALQPYDTGPGGRFSLQQIAVTTILEHPNGVGPFEFARLYGGQQHDVYMEGMLVYGWLGGSAYLTFVVATLLLGLRTVRIPTPWQPYLVAAYATFVGEAFEGIIIDSDHWRHFFLVMGLVWGLSVATINSVRAAWKTDARSGLA
jgi:hypothetical protein